MLHLASGGSSEVAGLLESHPGVEPKPSLWPQARATLWSPTALKPLRSDLPHLVGGWMGREAEG